MSLYEDIIRRWLDQVADDAAPRLERVSADGKGSEGETSRQMDRLRLVQGLLSTLDIRTAPKELEALVEMRVQEAVTENIHGIEEVNFDDWESAVEQEDQSGLDDFQFEPHKAPEFLDRIVEQSMRNHPTGSIQKHNPLLVRSSRWNAPRLLMTGVAVALVILSIPLILGDRSGLFGESDGGRDSSLRLVNYDSLEGLKRAFPAQSQVASGMGMLGAFGASSDGLGDPR